MSVLAMRLKTHRQRGQALVEFSLLAPLLIYMLLVTVDFGRLVYTYGAIAWAAREGARIASLEPQKITDCPIYQRIEALAQGFNIAPDPNSVHNNSDPNSPSGSLVPTTPQPGQGLIYIYPAVATASPQDVAPNCTGAPRKTAQKSTPVTVEVQYTYSPLVPLLSLPSITIKAVSVVQTEY